MVGLVETRLWGVSEKELHIDGFNVICADLEKSPHGIAVYYRDTLSLEYLTSYCESGIECMLIGLRNEIVIGFAYCPPRNVSITNFRNFMNSVSSFVAQYVTFNEKKLLLMGDFNFNSTEKASFSKVFLKTLNIRQLQTSVTTDYDSCLDHIYTNVCDQAVVSFGTLESYYSDHKPLFIAFIM